MNRMLAAALAAACGTAAGWIALRSTVRSARFTDLRGKVALITGGSRGLGLALAREAISRGARVAICARDETQLRKAQEELTSRGGAVFASTCDVTDPAAVTRFVRQVQDHFGAPVDMLINNAGIIQVGPASHMKLADYRQVMDVNFFGALHFILNLMPQMRERKSGRIVNIASFGGLIATPHLAPYAASKHALVGLSQSLRSELLDDGIYVTTVCPGVFRSGSPSNALFKGRQEQEFAWFATADNLPVISIAPDRLARKILDAAQRGQAELIAPLSAHAGAKLFAVAPGLATNVAALVNAFLPSRAGPGGDTPLTGRDADDGRLDSYTRKRLQAAQAAFGQER